MRNRALFMAMLLAPALPAQAPSLAVVEKIAGAVGFYTAEGRRVSGVKVGTHPHEVVLSPDKRHAYVSDNGILWMTDAGEGGNTISIVDVQAMKKAGVIDLGRYRRPHGMDIDPKSGRLVSTIENPDGLLLIDPGQRKVIRMYDVHGQDPHMVLLGPGAKFAYVSNTGSNTIAAVDLESGKVKLIPTDEGPQGGVLTPDGRRIYMTNGKGDSITLIDTAKNENVGRIKTGRGPNRIVLTPDGKTLVYSLGEGNAVAFADVAAAKETAKIDIGGRPMSLTLSADGKLAYAGVQDQDKVVVVSVPERRISRTIQTPKGSGPDPVLPVR